MGLGKFTKLDDWQKHRASLGIGGPNGPIAHESARPPLATGVRKWWEIASVADFRQAIELMPEDELAQLKADIRIAKTACAFVLQDTKEDPDRRRRARAALGFYIEKERLCQQPLRRKHDENRKKDPESYESLKERCQLLAAEVSRLHEERSHNPTDTRVAVALEFVEVCRIAMAESAFSRYMDRARDRVHGPAKKGPTP